MENLGVRRPVVGSIAWLGLCGPTLIKRSDNGAATDGVEAQAKIALLTFKLLEPVERVQFDRRVEYEFGGTCNLIYIGFSVNVRWPINSD